MECKKVPSASMVETARQFCSHWPLLAASAAFSVAVVVLVVVVHVVTAVVSMLVALPA